MRVAYRFSSMGCSFHMDQAICYIFNYFNQARFSIFRSFVIAIDFIFIMNEPYKKVNAQYALIQIHILQFYVIKLCTISNIA